MAATAVYDIINFIVIHLHDPTFIKNEIFNYKDDNEIKNFSIDFINNCDKIFKLHFSLLNNTNNSITCLIFTQIYYIELVKINNNYRWSLNII
jgi:hypothetical protein